MPDIRIVHEFACDEDTYWNKCFFDREFNDALFLRELKFPVYRITRQDDGPDSIVRRVEIEPFVGDVTGPIKKLMGDRFGYVEEGTFDKKTKRYRFRVLPSALADKTKIEGVFFLQLAGEKKVQRVAETHVSVKVFGVG